MARISVAVLLVTGTCGIRVYPNKLHSEASLETVAHSLSPHSLDTLRAPAALLDESILWLGTVGRKLRGGKEEASIAGGLCAKRWHQCGGKGFKGSPCCQAGLYCRKQNAFYSQCRKASDGVAASEPGLEPDPKAKSVSDPSEFGGGPRPSPKTGNGAGQNKSSTGAAGRMCGIVTNPGECQKNLALLGAGAAGKFNCFSYGGPRDPCSLNIMNDHDAGMSKDPSKCKSSVLFLWDEPFTQAQRGKGAWGSMSYVVRQWATYSSKWSVQLRKQRQAGMKVTTPFFTDHGGTKTATQMNQFFSACPLCSDKSSMQYIDVLVWNAWIGDWNKDTQGQARYIIGQSKKMSKDNGDRPVWLGNFGFLGKHGSVQNQIQAIESSGIFEKGNGIQSVYYFGATDYGGGTGKGTNTLNNPGIVSALLRKCV